MGLSVHCCVLQFKYILLHKEYVWDSLLKIVLTKYGARVQLVAGIGVGQN